METQEVEQNVLGSDEFVTVVNVQPTPKSETNESFVTVLSIGNSGKNRTTTTTATSMTTTTDEKITANGVDPAHPEEEVEVYRLPGERLGFGLKFEGGNKTSEKVRRLFIQSCAEQSPASRAKCSWGHLGEGDEVLSIDDVSVTQMTRLDCVRRLKESQLVIKLAVRYRGAMRPEVVSAERKLSGQQQEQQRSKVPPELPAAPPPVPPRKLRQANRGLADGEASPGTKKAWDSPKSNGSSNTGSPQSQGSFRSAASSIRSSNYESCVSSPAKSSGSKNATPKDSPKAHVSPILNKTKQDPPAEAQSYLDARSQDGSSTHGSTSDDTSSSLSTVVDRFSTSDRFSTTSTASTTSEQLFHTDVASPEINLNGDSLLNNVPVDFDNPDFLLARLANSEARIYVESRGDVERVTAVVAPNTVLIEETPTLQPPLSFQDAPLSYGHEPRPGIFYSADLAADSRTHFRPIKDDADIVEKVVNGDIKEAPPLPMRNHVNRIPVNQQEAKNEETEAEMMPILPPKPMPRKDVKAKRKRPPPPPPPPRREPPPPVPEARNVESINRREAKINDNETKAENNNDKIINEEYVNTNNIEIILKESNENKEVLYHNEKSNKQTENNEMEESEYKMNKVLEIVEMKKAKALSPRKEPSRTSDECEVPERGANASDDDKGNDKSYDIDVELKNSINRKILQDMSNSSTISIDLEDDTDEESMSLKDNRKSDENEDLNFFEKDDETLDDDNFTTTMNDREFTKNNRHNVNEIFQLDVEKDEDFRLVDVIGNDEQDIDEDDMSDESDADDYYWQSNLATIGEEEENNSLEYETANVDPLPSINKLSEKPEIIADVIENPSESSDNNAQDCEPDCVRRIARDSETEDKKQDKNVVNGRMDNCGGGGQRLPPDGDEFPAAYQEFTNPNSTQYQYVTTRETMAANGDVDRGESVVDGTAFIPAEKAILVAKTLNIAETRSILDPPAKKDLSGLIDMDNEKRTSVSNYVLYSTQKTVVPPNLVMEKKIEIAAYYPKESSPKSSDVDSDLESNPPPLPLTGPPKIDNQARPIHERKFSNSELWRQDNKSEKSVKDKIAMFSSQSNLEAPLFPTTIATSSATSSPSSNGNTRKLLKHKSSDDVFGEEKKASTVERTQSSFDLSVNSYPVVHHQKTPSLPQTSPPSSPGSFSDYLNNGTSNYLQKSIESNNKYPLVNSSSSSKSSSPLNSYSPSYNGGVLSSQSIQNKTFDTTSSPTKMQMPNGLIRATSFSGSSSPYGYDRLQTSSELLGNSPTIARANSMVSSFKRSTDDIRKSSLNQLIEQRRKGISKLRGLVIPEKDAVPVDQPIIDLPEIKSRDSIVINQVPRSNIQDKWGSQSSLVSNASTVSSSVRTSSSFKMPAPKILSNYSPAFKRKSLTVYGSSQPNNSHTINNAKNNTNNQLTSPASEAPKSLESICSPTRSDYSFDFVSSSGSPENNLPTPKPKINCQRKIGRNEYDDSDNDSAVSSSQSSISRGFSPPMSPVPSDRSTMSSERSYLSSETHYQRPQLILDSSKSNGTDIVSDKSIYNLNNVRSNLISERNFSTPEKSFNCKPSFRHQQQPQQQQSIDSVRSSQIPQRQMLKRSSSTETNSSNSSSSTLTSGSQASTESLSRRVLKPQSVEAINRKNILASARCRSGRDLNGSPLIQRKFSDEEDNTGNETTIQSENDGFVNAHRVTNGSADCTKPQIKIAYIEITENVVGDGEKFSHNQLEEKQQKPKLPPKRSIIPQAKNMPIPTSRPPKPETAMEPSNDMKSWVRAEIRTLTMGNGVDRIVSQESRNKPTTPACDAEPSRNYRSKSTLTLTEQNPSAASVFVSRNQPIQGGEGEIDLINVLAVKPKSRSNLALKKSADDHSDLLTVLTTKSRSRSAIHVEDTSYGKLKSQMSLEDILAVKNDSTKLPRSQSVTSSEKNGSSPFSWPAGKTTSPSDSPKHEQRFTVRRSNSTDSWNDEKNFASKIPSLTNSRSAVKPSTMENTEETTNETCERSKAIPCNASSSKIPMARNLGRRSASVTDMKKVFEKADLGNSSGTFSPGSQVSNTATHNRYPSLDSSVDENIRPVGVCEVDHERFSGEQFGSISSLASSTSLISQQELAQLVEEANLEEPRGGHDVVVVLLHKENPAGNVGITLAGGVDCETKEITIHRVLSHSIADRDGSVQRGDRILSINGRSMRGLTHRESLGVLKQPRSELVLVVSRAKFEDNGATIAGKLRTRTESVETIVEGYETSNDAAVENTAWGPALLVAVYKDGAGLGFSLEGGRDSPLGDRPLLIKKIFTGGAAEKTGALRAGDQLLEVNKRDVSKMSRIEAWSLMKKLPDGEVNLLVRHPATKSS